MPVFNMLAAKSNLSRLIDAVVSGRETEIIIARNGKPVARLVPLAQRPAGLNRPGFAGGWLMTLHREGLLVEGLDLVEQINATRKTPMLPFERVALTKKVQSTWLRRSFKP